MSAANHSSAIALAHALASTAVPADVHAQRLDGKQRPWQGTGVPIKRGESYSLFASGIIHWSAHHPELYAGPGFHLWARVWPQGRVVNVTRDSGSFVADQDGEIQLGIYLGMWQDAYGALDTPDSAYAKLRGSLEVCLVKWHGTATDGLDQLGGIAGHTLLHTERMRLANQRRLPSDWDYLLEIGTTDVFQDCTHSVGDDQRICLHALDEQAIVRKPIDFPLTPATRLSWRWQLEQHPSERPENTPHTHDYISVAAEFDNGRDLTWIWSSSLPVDSWFDCPIKAWRARETHYVVRSGKMPATDFIPEERNVHDDVARTMGPPSSRIVAVWLIVVASFQHGTARAEFKDIRLRDGQRTVKVL
jgi:hypothetical protein